MRLPRNARVIVCGSRDLTDRGAMAEALYHICEVVSRDDIVIVHGGQRGADTIAGSIGEGWGLTVEAHPADVKRYGSPAAYHIRNQEMADAGAALCVAFPGGAGTADCMRRCKKAGIRTVVRCHAL